MSNQTSSNTAPSNNEGEPQSRYDEQQYEKDIKSGRFDKEEFFREEGSTKQLSASPDPVKTGDAAESQSSKPWQGCVDAITPEVIERLVKWQGISADMWQKIKGLQMIGLYEGHIALPIFNANQEVIGCEHCPLDVNGTRVIKWFGDEKKLTPLTINHPKSKCYVYAFESPWDMFACVDLIGDDELTNDVTGFVTTRGESSAGQVAPLCNRDTTVYAFVGNGVSGKKWLNRIVKSARCKVCKVQTPVEFNDLNGWKQSGATKLDIFNATSKATTLCELPGVSDSSEDDDEDDFPDDPNEIDQDTKPGKFSTSGRTLVSLPTDNRLLSAFAEDLGRALSASDLFNRQGITFTLDQTNRGLKVVASDAFRTLVEDWVCCYKMVESKDSPPVRVYRSMSNTDAGAVLAARGFLNSIPPLKRLNHVRLPVKRNNGQIELLPDGYDAESQTYTFATPDIGNVATMTLDEAKAALNALFAEFCFPQDNGRSLSVAIGAMMTMFAYGLLPQGSLPPCFIIKANAEGAGKTLLVKTIISSVLGRFTAGVKPNNDEEVRKFLTAAVMEGRLYVVYDNVKDNLNSPALEGFLTAPEWSDRILGSSKNFSAEKFTVVFITGNNCAVSPDMRRRSLVVDLFMKEERAEARTFTHELEAYVRANRAKIYAALWTLVQAWDNAGRPLGSMSNSSFQEWSRIIGSIVEHAGYVSPLTPSETLDDMDRDAHNMRLLAAGLQPDAQLKSFTFSELIEHARSSGAFEDLLGLDEPMQGSYERKMHTIISRVLKRYNGRTVGCYTFHAVGVGHSRRYEFRRMDVGRGGMPAELLAQ